MGGGASRAVSNMPKVSVIVPVFNTAQYLEECLTSILNQSLADIEIICIDDGSKDGSLGILRRFSESDNRIKVLTQENSGAGVARNLGMKHATGTYLSFLDSDDVFEPSMLERLYNLAEERDLDIAVCRCDKFDSMTGKTRPADNSIKAALLPPHGPFAANEIKKDFFEAFIWWPWDKLFRRSFVEDNSLEYMALRTTNDLYYVACNMLLATRIDYVDDVLVHQRVHESSLSKTRNRSSDCFYKALLAVQDFLVARQLYDRYKDDFVNYCATFSIWQLESMGIEGYLSLRKDLPAMFKQLGLDMQPKTVFYRPTSYTKIRRILSWPEVCVSVILPSLNVAPYIRECVDSILGQTLKNIEVICVDAGSTDGTLEILREYEVADPRVRVIVSGKKSYGHQMNLGIKAAKGEYIGIVETDDFASSDMFERLYAKAKGKKAQVVKGNYYNYQSTPFKRELLFERYKGLPYNRLLSNSEKVDLLEGGPCIWSGIYERQFLVDSGIDFLETPGASYQDTGFILKVWIAADRILLTDEAYLHYRNDNPGSSVHAKDKAFYVCDEMRSAHEYLQNYYPDRVSYLAEAMWVRRASAYFWNYQRLAEEYRIPFINRVREEFSSADIKLRKEMFPPDHWEMIAGALSNPQEYCSSHGGGQTSGLDRDDDRPVLSIIVNTVGCGDVLQVCLDSLAGQTSSGFEVICIDSLLSMSDTNLINGFVSDGPSARKVVSGNETVGGLLDRAIGQARGSWMLFINGNDALEPNAVATMGGRLALSNDDVLLMSHDVVSLQNNTVFKQASGVRLGAADRNRRVSAETFGKRILQISGGRSRYKLFRTEFVRTKDLHFTDHNYNNDVEFCAFGLLGAKSVAVLEGRFCSELIGSRDHASLLADRNQGEILLPWIDMLDQASLRGFYPRYEETLVNAVADAVARDLQKMGSYSARTAICKELARGHASDYGIAFRAKQFYDSSSTCVKMRNAVKAASYSEMAPFSPSKTVVVSHVAAEPEPNPTVPIVSVIIPAYNTGAYLRDCLDSICSQSLKNIEIICIDDGSTDDTALIAKEFAARDSRITYVYQDNAGQSVARNAGVERARGKYLYFIDSDDQLESDALEVLSNRMESRQLDIIFFEGICRYEEGVSVEDRMRFDNAYTRLYNYDATYSGGELFHRLYSSHDYWCSPCMQMVSRAHFLGNGLWFYPGLVYEDNLYTFKALLSAKRASCCHRTFYRRRVRPDSIMTGDKTYVHAYSYFKIHSEMNNWCMKHELDTRGSEAASMLIQSMARHAVNQLLDIPWDERDSYWALPPDEQARFIATVKAVADARYWHGVEERRAASALGKAKRLQEKVESLNAIIARKTNTIEKLRQSKAYHVGSALAKPMRWLKSHMRGMS